ncbi:hypothetical protein GCK72_006893 [Caenorhabditis remanei]|uniref:Domain of unknown function WSN domain-containing protein n=1 Tax=Caenorhabditis remanei TaxID=31234 RepID=A0A6A5HHH2_CAERE|nr:hypothetical protein GCK72_006893 [Caenorhabditis remanei]KAF1766935.1 hypothetical protein GCK72_006893 [Caenorhabditis remanei]
MQLPYRYIKPGAVILISITIALIITFITWNGGNKNIESKVIGPSKLVRDHLNLAKLFNIIHLNCGFLSGELTSDETIDKTWNLPDEVSTSKILSIDLKKLSRDLKALLKTMEKTPWSDVSFEIERSKIMAGFDAIDQKKPFQHIETSELESVFMINWQTFYNGSSEMYKNIKDLENNQTVADFKLVNLNASKYLTQLEDVHKIFSHFGKPTVNSTPIISDDLFNILDLKDLSSAAPQLAHFKLLISKMSELNLVFPQLKFLDTFIAASNVPSEMLMADSTDIFSNEEGSFLRKIFKNEDGLKSLLIAISPIDKYVAGISRLADVLPKHPIKPEIINSFVLQKEIKKNLKLLETTLRPHACFDRDLIDRLSKLPNKNDVNLNHKAWSDVMISLQQNFYILFSEKFRETYQNSSEKLQAEIHNITGPSLNTLVSNENFETVKTFVFEMKKFSKTMMNYTLSYSKEKEKVRIERKVFQDWINSTLFDNSYPTCLEQELDFPILHTFSSFHKTIGILRDGSEIENLIRNSIRSMRQAQDLIRELTRVSTRISRLPASHNSNELCQRMKKKKLLEFEQGVEYLNLKFEVLKQKNQVQNLSSYEDVVVQHASTIKDRNHRKYMIEDYFQYLKANEPNITEMFQQIENLEQIHLTEDWNSLSSLSRIYEMAAEITSPMDWVGMNEVMEEIVMEGENNTNLTYALKITRELAKMPVDLDLEQVAFKDSKKSLKDTDKDFNEFFEWSKPKPIGSWKSFFKNILIIITSALLLIGTIVFLILMARQPSGKRRLTAEDRASDPDFQVNEKNEPVWSQLLQTSRLAINQRDENGYTQLFLAVEYKDYELAKALIEQGAAIDAACGPKHRSALQQASKCGERKMVELLLKSGADRKCRDSEGKNAKRLCSSQNYTKSAFAKYYNYKHIQQIPCLKRDFYVLIVERARFDERLLEFLPDGMEVVYGYREGEVDLGDFTHFVMGPSAEGAKDIVMDLNHMLTFEILSKPGVIVSMEWLYACIDDTNQMFADWKFLLTDVTFEEKTHHDVITRIKNDIHRLRPPLLHDCEITILPTRNRIMKADRDIWIRIIESFGGKYTTSPYPALPNQPPYHYTREKMAPTITRSIVLYFGDSVIEERWTWPENCISLIGMGWLPESIVRYQLLRPDDRCLSNEPDFMKLQMIRDI